MRYGNIGPYLSVKHFNVLSELAVSANDCIPYVCIFLRHSMFANETLLQVRVFTDINILKQNRIGSYRRTFFHSYIITYHHGSCNPGTVNLHIIAHEHVSVRFFQHPFHRFHIPRWLTHIYPEFICFYLIPKHLAIPFSSILHLKQREKVLCKVEGCTIGHKFQRFRLHHVYPGAR